MKRRTATAMATFWPVLAGCGAGPEAVAGDQPITPAAIAAVATEHAGLGRPSRVAEWSSFVHEFGVPSPSASLSYDDASLKVGVAPTSDSSWLCVEPSVFDGCVDTVVDGHEVLIVWQELVPEEDPGIVLVIDRRDHEDVVVEVAGADVTQDPRLLTMGVPLADVAALATDRRISLTTSRAVIDLGTELGRDLEVEPAGPVVSGAAG